MQDVFKKLDINVPAQFGGGGGKQPSLKDAAGFEVYVRFKVAEAGGPDVGGTCPTDALAWLAKPCTNRSRCLAGYKRLALVTSPEKMHKNPVITGLELNGVDWPADVTPTVPCYRGDDQYGQSGVGAVTMTPAWTAESQETIGPNPDASKKKPLVEGLLFSWLSTAGDWRKQRSFDEVPENEFLPPDYGGKATQRVRIWVVARDGRNGTTWLSRQIDVQSGAKSDINPLCVMDPKLDGCDKN